MNLWWLERKISEKGIHNGTFSGLNRGDFKIGSVFLKEKGSSYQEISTESKNIDPGLSYRIFEIGKYIQLHYANKLLSKLR